MKRILAVLAIVAIVMLCAGLAAIAWTPRFPPNTYRFDTSSLPVNWNPDGGTLGSLSNGDAITLVDNAFDVWDAVTTAAIDFAAGPQLVDGSGTPVDVTAANYAEIIALDNGQHPIVFDNDAEIFQSLGFSPSIAAFSGFLDTSGGTIEKSLLVFNGELIDGDAGDSGEISMELFFAVVVHEVGHFFGLGHNTINRGISGIGGCPAPTTAHRTTMNPSITTSAATLHQDDEVGISELYPTQAFGDLPTIGGHLIDTDGTTPFDGGNMILRMDTTDCDAIYDVAQGTQSGSNPDEWGGAGGYRFSGLTKGSDYTVRAESITQSGSYPIGGSSPPQLGGPDDFYNATEDFFDPPDAPDDVMTVPAGSAGIDIGINNSGSPGLLGPSLRVDLIGGGTGVDPQQLQLDDGSGFNNFGFTSTTRLAWMNRFTPDPSILPFRIERLDVIFSSSSIAPGRAIRLLVYEDAMGSGDPANATLVHNEDTVVQDPLSSTVFQEFTLASPIVITAGEFYLGVFDLLADDPTSFIAAYDPDSMLGRSYIQPNGTDPENYTVCQSGNPCSSDRTWMIRAYGSTVPADGTLELSWGDACNAATLPGQDYAVYQGSLDQVPGTTDLAPLACGGNLGQSLIVPGGSPDDLYFLVTPLLATREGSLNPRAPTATCVTEGPDSCP